ncbi:hypothetical protein [Chryseobacterium camelliae]|uniref:hypothetical protein n=1 Tax=Chryseobacterium camelliae TaxID=1265445 RepID=UPI000C1CB3CD|nr:hypothetical protein [Chryseobacterium camelliae]
MSIENLTTKELEEKFDNFIFNIDDYIESLEDKAEHQDLKLDLSLNSLEDLEQFILKCDISVNSDEYNDCSAYLGEVVVQNFKGKWICNLDKENNSLYYGFPVVIGHSKEGVLFSPFHVVKAFILRKKHNLFIDAIKSQVEPTEIDWSKFPSEE